MGYIREKMKSRSRVDLINTFVILLLIFSGCYCGSNSIGDRRDVGIKDVVDICGTGRYPSFDYQCYKVEGCMEINKGSCGCRCTRCEYERCVEMSCNGGCIVDGGRELEEIRDVEEVFDIEDEDVGDVVDEKVKDVMVEDVFDVEEVGDVMDVGDADNYEYVCKDPGDPEGVEFSGNLDEPIVLISNRVYMDAYVTGEYVVWVEAGSSGYGRDVYYLSLLDRKVRRVPNCDGKEFIISMSVSNNKIYWTNFIDYKKKGNEQEVMFYYNIDEKIIRIISPLDLIGRALPYKNSVFFKVYKEKRRYMYYEDIDKLNYRWIDIDEDFGGYYDALWENLIVGSIPSGGEIYSYNIDTFEKKIHYQSNLPIAASPLRSPLPIMHFLQYIDESVYGHPTTDVFLIDLRTDEVKRITDDENFQFAGGVWENIIIYHENEDPKESDVNYGYLVVYDMDTKVKRKVKEVSGIVSCRSFNGRYFVTTPSIYSGVKTFYLVDLEKLGVIKDGHVVPE